jgi:hypothetical protein
MTLPNNISLFSSKKYYLTILFCVLGSSILLAQSEKERVSQEFPKYQDGVGVNENSDAHLLENKGDYSIKLQPSKYNTPCLSTYFFTS